MSCGLFRTFVCGSFRSWTFSPLPQSFRTKIRTISAILLRPAASKRSETEPPESRVLRTLRNTAAPGAARGVLFLVRTDGTFGTTGTCGTQMRRDQKFFYLVKRRAGAAPQKTILNKVCHSVNLCPISPISPISPRNAPAAPFECPRQ